MQSTLTVSERLRDIALSRGEELLAEIPGAVRRIGLMLLVLAISVPLFLAACVALLAWFLLV